MSVIGLVVFKKLVGLSGRKYVNPAAAAKLVVMIPFINTLLLAIDHLKALLKVPSLAGPIGLTNAVNGNGGGTVSWIRLHICSAASLMRTQASPATTINNLLQTCFWTSSTAGLAEPHYCSYRRWHRLLHRCTQIR